MQNSLPRLTHEQFLEQFQHKWRQGQHVLLIGPTGSGKTIVAQDVEELRQHVVVIATKAKDESLERYKRFSKMDHWPPQWYEKLILYWKRPRNLGDFKEQRAGIYQVMSDLYEIGGWTVYFDDLYYVSNTLGLKGAIQMFYTQVRSNNVSIMASIQRPAWVPLEAVSQSTYALVFSIRDERDIVRVAEGLSLAPKELKSAIGNLKQYEFLFLETGQPLQLVEKRKL